MTTVPDPPGTRPASAGHLLLLDRPRHCAAIIADFLDDESTP